MYKPKPIDTSEVVLPNDLIELTEQIAENVHEVWSQNRINDGWKYGEVRNDSNKETPCLVPYSRQCRKNIDVTVCALQQHFSDT